MDEALTLGIDEAGMGPVFGPLIISGVVIKEKDADHLKDIGVKDSKMFGSGLNAHDKRAAVWEAADPYLLREKQVVIDAHQLDKCNMHDLHIEATKKILQELGWDKIDKVIVEQIGGMKEETFRRRLGFWHEGFIYEQKADVNYPVVSLASIKAKVLRDNIVIKLCEDLDEEYVSGYANYKTESFFRRYYERYGCLPPGTRISRKWAPIEEMSKQWLI